MFRDFGGALAKDFRGTLTRLVVYLRPHQTSLALVVLAGAIGTVFSWILTLAVAGSLLGATCPALAEPPTVNVRVHGR